MTQDEKLAIGRLINSIRVWDRLSWEAMNAKPFDKEAFKVREDALQDAILELKAYGINLP